MPIAADSFTGVDLSRLPAPTVIEPLDFETIYADALAEFQTYFPAFDATVESDPVVKLLQLFAYRELVLRQRVNEAAKAVMVAYAAGADLDHLGALFGVERFVITPAVPLTNTPAVLEADADFRRRMTLAPEGFSVAGPSGAYIFHALSADPQVRDASAESPSAGEVVVSVLARTGDGSASAALLATVSAVLSSDTVRPMTDHVTVQSAAIVPFAITATLTFLSGPDRSVVLAQAQARLTDHLARSLVIGRDVTRSGIIAALYAPGVQNVALANPGADIVVSRQQAAHCTGIALTDGGVGE